MKDLKRLYSTSPPLAKEAFRIQKELSKMVKHERPGPIRAVAGADISILVGRKKLVCGVIVFSWPELEEIERAWTVSDEVFPYIPGLLGFREAPCIVKTCGKLKTDFDLLMIDGHGLAHPKGFGLACHVGVVLDVPTIGVAKKPLYGTFEWPGETKGERTPMRGGDGGETIGVVLRTRDRVKPVFVSVGNRTDLDAAVSLTLECARGYRLPEPTRLADGYVASLKKAIVE